MAAKCAGFLESLQNAFGCSDLYELFGVDKDSTTSEIKKAYRRLSLKVHPDRAKPEDVEDYTNKFQVRCVYKSLSVLLCGCVKKLGIFCVNSISGFVRSYRRCKLK